MTPHDADPDASGNATHPGDLPQEAEQQAGKDVLAVKVAVVRRQRWTEENRDAISAWNAYVAVHGLPLEAYRRF